jgi:hypothetical protein
MDVLILLLFVSLVLVVGALLLFAKAITGGDFEHGDRLALLPLDGEGREESRERAAPPAERPMAPEPGEPQEEKPRHE